MKKKIGLRLEVCNKLHRSTAKLRVKVSDALSHPAEKLSQRREKKKKIKKRIEIPSTPTAKKNPSTKQLIFKTS